MGDAASHRFDFLSVEGRRVDLVSWGGVSRHTKTRLAWIPGSSSERRCRITPKKGMVPLCDWTALTVAEPAERTAKNRVRTVPNAPRRSCLAHEAPEISKSVGR